METNNLVQLINALAWPLTLVIVVVMFRRQVATILTRIREVEGPGEFKVRLDQAEIKKLIEDGQQANMPASELAQRIVKYVELKDARELRILRALFDEPTGRGIYSYAKSSFYRPAIDNLLAKGCISREDKKFKLTATGEEVCRQYLQTAIAASEGNQRNAHG